jgi:hypothetical protein
MLDQRVKCPLMTLRFESEECSLNPVGIQINLRVEESAGQLLGIGNGMPPAEFMREQLGMILGGQSLPRLQPCPGSVPRLHV